MSVNSNGGGDFTKTNKSITSVLRNGGDQVSSGSYGVKEQGWLQSNPPSVPRPHTPFLPGTGHSQHPAPRTRSAPGRIGG